MGEVRYSLARSSSDPAADEPIIELTNLGFDIVDTNWEITRQAAYFKSRSRLACTDCFAAALAKTIHGP